MDKSVIISIKGRQSYENVEDETIELVTEGLLAKEGEGGLHPQLSGERAHRPGGHPDHLPD